LKAILFFAGFLEVPVYLVRLCRSVNA
jgi:hypothetical protein